MDTVHILNAVVQDYQTLAYLVIFIGLIFEGEVVVITTGVLSRVGALNFWLSLGFIILGGTAKTFGGYYLGQLIHRYYNHLSFIQYIERRVAFFIPRFREKPFWSIFISQFIMGVNYLVIIYSGYHRINYKTYLKADLSSTLIWAPLLMSIGYFFGEAALSYTSELSTFSIIIFCLILIFLLFDKIAAYFFRFSTYVKKVRNFRNNGKKSEEKINNA